MGGIGPWQRPAAGHRRKEEKGIPPGTRGLNFRREAILELNVEEWLGLLHTDSEERGSRGQAQPKPRPRVRKAGVDLGTGHSL